MRRQHPFGKTGAERLRDRAGHLVSRPRRPQARDRGAAARPRSRHDPYRHRRDVWRCRARHCRGDRRTTRRGVPGLEGAAEQRLAARHHHRLRALAEAAEDRPARLLSAALARLLSAGRHGRRVRGAGAAPERSAPGASAISTPTISTKCSRSPAKASIACNQVLYHLQERAIEHAVIPWCEQHGVAVVAYSPFGHNDFPRPRSKAGAGAAEDRGGAWRDAASGRAGLSDPATIGVRDSESRRSAEHAADNAAAGNLMLERKTRSRRSMRRFRAARNRAACRCCSAHKRAKHGY